MTAVRILVDYDAGTPTHPCCTDRDTGLPAPDWSLAWLFGGSVCVNPPETEEVVVRRNGQDRLIYNRAIAQAFEERQGQLEYEGFIRQAVDPLEFRFWLQVFPRRGPMA